MLLLAISGLHQGTKDRLYPTFPHVHKVLLYEGETWLVREEDVIRVERDDANMVVQC